MATEQTVEQEALHLGWVPKEDFKGNPEKWIDAEAFVQRGKELMPILRKNNETLQGKIGQLESQLAETRGIIAQHSEAMEAMKDLQKKAVKEAIQRTQAEVRSSLKLAKDNGVVAAEITITVQLGEVKQQLTDLDAKPPAEAKPATHPAQGQVDPFTAEWVSRNSWFNEDPAMQGLVMGVAQKIKANPNTSNLTGRAFYDKLDEMLADYLPSRRQAAPKVEGARGSGGGGGGSGEKTYAGLPADAKAECDREASRFVGEGKAFKSKEGWRAHFAQLYWGDE